MRRQCQHRAQAYQIRREKLRPHTYPPKDLKDHWIWRKKKSITLENAIDFFILLCLKRAKDKLEKGLILSQNTNVSHKDVLDSNNIPVQYNKDYFEHIRKINDIFYDQIKISDQKAAYIFTFMLAFLVSSSEGRGVFTMSRYGSGDVPAIVASALLACSSVFSIIAAISVVLPRKGSKTSSLFWGAWQKHRVEFLHAAERNDPNYLFEEYVSNVDTLAEIARSKYRFAGLAFRGLVVTVLAYVFLLVAI